MADKFADPIGRLMGFRYKSHPWHGVCVGKEAPETVTSYIEVVSTDTVKYEVDKTSGYLKIDRPQKYSSNVPALYGFIPQTYCGQRVGDRCNEMANRQDIKGDKDPLDIIVLTEKAIAHGDILVHAHPIGGFRMIDGNEADDKIIAVLQNDFVYGDMRSIHELSDNIVNRLKHYFLTYKDIPGEKKNIEIVDVYDIDEAKEVINRSLEDYCERFENLGKMFSNE